MPCMNHGECKDLVADVECKCGPYYDGKYCEEIKDVCTNTTCKNNGTCIPTSNAYVCEWVFNIGYD